MQAFLWILLLAAGDPEKGRELFRSCSGCHVSGRAPKLDSLFGKVTLRNGSRVSDENVREIVQEGFNGMPSFRYSFRAAEMDDLMAYLRTMKGRPAQTDLAAGPGYFKAWCARCHSATEFPERLVEGSVQRVEEGHAGTQPLSEWLDGAARKILFDYLRSAK